jgi:predicted ferric reductase
MTGHDALSVSSTMISPSTTTTVPMGRRVRLPRTWPIARADIGLVLVANGLLVAAMWLRHGGLDLLASPSGVFSAAGQVTALLGTYLALVGVVLMARVPAIDQVVGSDRLTVWHRWVGFGTLWLLLAHFALTTLGWATESGRSVIAELLDMLSTWDVLIATVGLASLVLVAVTSIRHARRRLAYETWYGLHLYAYLGIALAFLHQVTMGSDLVADPLALWYWVALYVVTFGLLIGYRVLAPIRLSLRHRLRVADVVREAPDVVSIYLAGRNLEQLPVRAGQFFQVRFLTGGGWWRPHPFSISAAPNGSWLRLTIKDLGDDTRRMQSMPIGVKVFIEGPYGAFTAARIRRPRVVMIGGGVGVTPMRAILEELPQAPGAVTFLYREGTPEEVIFRAELAALARSRGADVRLLVGHRGSPLMPVDPLAPENLGQLVPDIATADVLVCGSRPFTERTLASLRSLGVPASQVHAERFGY